MTAIGIIIWSYFLLNAWIVWWFWRALKGGNIWVRIGICVFFSLLAFLYPVLFRSGVVGRSPSFFLQLGAIWTGVAFYAFLIVLFFEAGGLYKRTFHKTFFTWPAKPRYGSVVIVCLLTFGVALGSWINARHPVLNKVEITIRTDKEGYGDLTDRSLTLGVITDLHLGCLVPAERLAESVALLKEGHPDILLFAGDVLDDHEGLNIPEMKKIIAGITPPLGIWACPGNHEYYSGEIGKSIGILEECGIKVLRDDFSLPGGKILLIGRDDYSRSRGTRKSLEEILSRVPANGRNLPAILMDHQPRNLEEAEEADMDLQLSGHTHYGQIWPANLIVKSVFENARGHSRKGDTHYIVSAGAGTWGPPLRNTCRPEVLLVKVHFTDRQD